MADKISCSTIIPYESRLLLIREPVDGQQLYGLAGGTLEYGDTLVSANPVEVLAHRAINEVAEESGLQVEIESFVGRYFFHKGGSQKNNVDRFVFAGKVVGGALLRPTETGSAGFYHDESIRRFDEARLLRSNGTLQAIHDYRERGVYDMSVLNGISLALPAKRKKHNHDSDLLRVA